MDFVFWGVVLVYIYVAWQEFQIANYLLRVENTNNLEMETIK